MKKRVVALMLTAGMMIGALTGCGQADDEKMSAKKETSSVEESKAESVDKSEAPEKKEIESVKWVIMGDPMEDQDLVLEEVNKILAERYSLELELIDIPMGEYDQKTQLMINAGEDFDLIWTSDWSCDFLTNVSRDAFLPLDELLESEAAQALMEVYPKWMLEYTKVNGTLYGLPNYKTHAIQQGAFVQKDLADKYGLDYNKKYESLEELEPFFEQILDNEEGIWPLYEGGTVLAVFEDYDTLVAGTAVSYYDEAKVELAYSNTSFVENLKKMREYYQKGFFRSDLATCGNTTADLNANRYAVTIHTYAPNSAGKFTDQRGEEYVGIALGEPTITMRGPKATMTAINVNSKNPEAAIKMYGVCWTDPEIYNLLCFGIEGIHYNMIGENRAEFVENTKYNRTFDTSMFGTQNNAYLFGNMPDNMYEITDEMNATLNMSSLAGFVLDLTSVETEKAQCTAVKNEFGRSYSWTDDFDKWLTDYTEKMKAAGAEKIVEEAQRQIDEWEASKNK